MGKGNESLGIRLRNAVVTLAMSLAASAALAVDTASAQGWRRPLLAWLRLQQLRAERAGDATEALRLGRRIELVLSAGSPTAEPR